MTITDDLFKVTNDAAEALALAKGAAMTIAPADKEKKTAQELADMIGAHINLGGTFIKVHADPAYGWHPTVITTPGNVIRCQQMAEEAARELRAKYDLKQ